MALIKQTVALDVKPSVHNHRQLYADLYTNFDKHPDKQDLVLYSNEESVKRAIKNILFTNRGEKLFDPSFGGNLSHLLFENATPVTESLIKNYVESAINNFEPRARLIDVYVSSSPDENSYDVTILFTTINIIEPITLSFILNRTR